MSLWCLVLCVVSCCHVLSSLVLLVLSCVVGRWPSTYIYTYMHSIQVYIAYHVVSGKHRRSPLQRVLLLLCEAQNVPNSLRRQGREQAPMTCP
jgi:hypothetical protein